jgi:hypothetical protein
MSETDQPNFVEQAGNFAADATIDTGADGVINRFVDGVAGHLPGGEGIDTIAKTGIDLAANNAINAEVGKLEGMFGHHEPEPEAQQ